LGEKLDEKFIEVLTKFRTIKDTFTPVIISVVPTPKPLDLVKLPRIQLPSFSGSYQEWSSFSDLFISTVHSNASLAGAQKLQYLKSSLSGDAASLIKSFPVTDARLHAATGEPRSRSFLVQRISLAIQRANATCVVGTIPHYTKLNEIFNLWTSMTLYKYVLMCKPK
jgi:hypothetical protein